MRRPTTRQKPRTSSLKSYPAANGGWIANRNIAQGNAGGAQGAAILENFFPGATSIVMRRGSELYATLGDGSKPVTSLWTYINGNQQELFAATDDAVYDVTTIASPNNWWLATENGDYIETDTNDYFGALSTIGLEELTGQNGGNWVVVQFATAGGVFLRGVNGADTPFVYDGTTYATTPAITGAVPEDLSYVWAYKNRLFFVEKESLNAWYLPVDSIGGAAAMFPLGGVFTRGGHLLFGLSWSLDAGNGLNEQCVFISSEGEVAVYQGGDPSSATDWGLVGVYRVGRPLGAKAHIRAGGDVIIATDIGFVPLSQAINRDFAALSTASVSYPIEDAWNNAVYQRATSPWHCETWSTRQMFVLAIPSTSSATPGMFIANTRTGAWANYTGWDGTCLAIFKDRLFFGSSDGRVVEANVSGLDEGRPFTAAYMPLFEDMGSPASIKIAEIARAVIRSPYPINELVGMNADYDETLPPPPDGQSVTGANVWGAGVWGQSVWGASAQGLVQQDWVSATAMGYALSPSVQITSGDLVPLDAEVIRLDVTFQTAEIVT